MRQFFHAAACGARNLGFAILAAGLAIAIGLVLAPAARANDGAVLATLASDSFAEIEAGIAAVAASGLATAPDLIAAIGDRRAFYRETDRKVFYKTAAGETIDAATGEKVADAGEIAAIRVNNRVRSAVQAALGALTLMARDPARRREAAEAVFKSRDIGALPALDRAIAAEKDVEIRRVFAEARAAVILAAKDTSEADRLGAVALLRARGTNDALALLSTLPADAPPKLRDAAREGAEAIQSRLAVAEAAQNVWYGLSLGSVLLLAAIGLAITFGVMGVINMAHGEMVMLGAYTTFLVQEWFRANAPSGLDSSLFVAIPLAFVVTGLVGIAIERGIIRFLYGRPLETLLATFGVSLILQQGVRTAFGPTNREVSNPAFMAGNFDLFGIQVANGRMWIIVFAILVFLGLLAILRLTRLGLEMRAVTQNRRMAASVGIRTGFVDAMTFGLGSGIAGLAGVALSQIDNVSPNLGQGYIIDSFLVVVFGGVGNLWGTLVAALSIGMANKLLEPFAGAVLGKIALLVFIILFIQKRPRGLFALKGRAIEQ